MKHCKNAWFLQIIIQSDATDVLSKDVYNVTVNLHCRNGTRGLYSCEDPKISQRRKLIHRQMVREGNQPSASLAQA